MIHLITLSGNSQRFLDKGYPHKALLQVGEKTSMDIFTEAFEDFNEFETIFICREEDLENTHLRERIAEAAPNARVVGVEKNNKGPIFSISKVLDQIPDDEEILVTYIDSIQKISLKLLL